MLCPSCTDERLAISDRAGIEIDYCPRCRGVWLDRGELDKIIERSSGDSPKDADERWRIGADWKQPKHDPYEKKRKRKTFLDEIFDF